MKTRYQMPRSRRMERTHLGGRFKAGLLAPVQATKLIGSESALLSVAAHFNLDPIPGEILSPIYGEVVSVFVPLQAIHALANPTHDYPGSADVVREALAAGNSLTALEEEGVISKRLGINPKSVSGTKMVDGSARLAYIAAVNFLRQRKYVNATLLSNTETAISAAVLSQTVLDKLNGVLDPEDRINGAVKFSGTINIDGVGLVAPAGEAVTGLTTVAYHDGNPGAVDGFRSNLTDIFIEKQVGLDRPNVTADLGSTGSTISLSDFYNAEKMDRLTREMRAFVDKYPQHGEEIVTKWALGLSLDISKQPVVLYERRVALNSSVMAASDGASLGELQTEVRGNVSFTVPVPATEFGGVVVTMMAVKPDEVIGSQPHPFFTEPFAAYNHVADELAIDPVAVSIKDLYADCATVDEDTVALYVGNNGLKRDYETYGWNRALDTTTVEAETSIWQLEVPMSVTPETVVYPSPLPQTPFADPTSEVCTYHVKAAAVVATPIIFGPTPVEELAAIETEDVFEDAT